MSKHARDRRPYVKPVTKLELSESNIKFRWIAIAVLLSIAVVSIGYGFSQMLNTEPGWQQVTTVSNEVNCGADFVFMYEFSAETGNPTVEYKKLESLYTDLTEEGYRLFNPEAAGADNLRYLNANVNTEVTVAPALYRALVQLVESGSRYPYMAPVNKIYDPVFLAAADAEAALYDPARDPEQRELVSIITEFCNDPEMVSLELVEENKVRLNVAQAYLDFAEEYGIDVFLDFGWMKNAFVVDYMAQALEEQGFIAGYVASYDGFTRNLDSRGTEFGVNVYHRQGNDIWMPASFLYTGPMSIVPLRDYPLTEQDKWHYYAYSDGMITSLYLDPTDGQPRSSVSELTAYSRELGCAEILLKTAPVFIAEKFDAEALESLVRFGIHSFRCSEKNIVCTEENAPIQILDDQYCLTVSNIN